MKLLLFSDLHCDQNAAHALCGMASQADVLVGAGDFANARRGLEICLPPLLAIGKPLVLVAGNNESPEELSEFCADYDFVHVLHGRGIAIEGVPFWGVGGGVPATPFGAWSYDLSEAEAALLLADAPQSSVLISHSPPKGCLDQSSRGQSLGSEAVKNSILQIKPKLVVCGHIHASGGRQARLEGNPVVNAGPEGLLWTL